MVRGRAKRRPGAVGLALASRRASVAVIVRQMSGVSADSRLNSWRSSLQYQAVAHRGDRCGAAGAGKERDLADRAADADFGDRLVAALDVDAEAAGDDDVERVGRVALAHQYAAAGDRDRLQPLFELAEVALGEFTERLDGPQAGLLLPAHLYWQPPRARPPQAPCGIVGAVPRAGKAFRKSQNQHQIRLASRYAQLTVG